MQGETGIELQVDIIIIDVDVIRCVEMLFIWYEQKVRT